MAHILFVCTGNTCRSALAEGLARALLGPEGGLTFGSAGLYALEGAPPTSYALAAAAELGVDLSAHRARSVSAETIEGAARIYVMTRAPQDGVTRLAARAGGRVALLDPAGQDIPDPYGADLDTYRRVRDRIVAAIEGRRKEWGTGAAG